MPNQFTLESHFLSCLRELHDLYQLPHEYTCVLLMLIELLKHVDTETPLSLNSDFCLCVEKLRRRYQLSDSYIQLLHVTLDLLNETDDIQLETTDICDDACIIANAEKIMENMIDETTEVGIEDLVEN